MVLDAMIYPGISKQQQGWAIWLRLNRLCCIAVETGWVMGQSLPHSGLSNAT